MYNYIFIYVYIYIYMYIYIYIYVAKYLLVSLYSVLIVVFCMHVHCILAVHSYKYVKEEHKVVYNEVVAFCR